MQKTLPGFLLSISLALPCLAQNNNTPLTDGFDAMMRNARMANPNYDKDVAQLNTELRNKGKLYTDERAAQKTTVVKEVPVIFHVVLTADQLAQIGGQPGAVDRINSQMDVLNKDYNAANPDAATIPGAFKPLYGNANIHFSLAHRDAQGKYTPGYEFVTTTKAGFDVNAGTTGSKFACSDAKFAATGGADGWDPQKYINVWVINITPAGVGGVGTPPPYAAYGGTSQFPWNEQGVAMAYYALGKRANGSQYYPAASAVAGRTLVHEMGHFFNLFHPFGISTLNNSNCLDDDGVNDTPLESQPSLTNCPGFPFTDNCTPTAPGVMFMNHMDYTPDTCRTMFTVEQVGRMNVELAPGGFRESLTKNPGIIYTWPNSVAAIDDEQRVQIFPNPASTNCTIWFGTKTPNAIVLLNNMGQVVKTLEAAKDAQQMKVNLAGMQRGVYAVRCVFNDAAVTQRLVVD